MLPRDSCGGEEGRSYTGVTKTVEDVYLHSSSLGGQDMSHLRDPYMVENTVRTAVVGKVAVAMVTKAACILLTLLNPPWVVGVEPCTFGEYYQPCLLEKKK